jgi:hypothetical protein
LKDIIRLPKKHEHILEYVQICNTPGSFRSHLQRCDKNPQIPVPSLAQAANSNTDPQCYRQAILRKTISKSKKSPQEKHESDMLLWGYFFL